MRKLLGMAAVASVLGLASGAQASTVWTFSGQSAKDGAVDATATINFTATGITVGLDDLLANPKSDGQTLSGIQIFFNTLPTSASLTSASGTEINIAKGGGTSGDDNIIHHWGTALSGGSLFLDTAGTGSAGGQPFDLIIGPGPYTNANAGLVGKSPYILDLGNFSVALGGLTSTSYITKVNLNFGTETDLHSATCSGDCGPPTGGVPEPASWMTMILGLGGIGAMMRRQRAVLA